MRALRHTYVIVVATLMASCHSPLITVERRSSGAVERAFEFIPDRGPDGHFVAFPAHPFINCLDTLQIDPKQIKSTPCADNQRYQEFVGYGIPNQTKPVVWFDSALPPQQAALQRTILDTFGHATAAQKAARVSNPKQFWPRPILSFLHFSDVQIREPEAKLGGGSISGTLDNLIQSFERDYDQEQYSAFVYAAFVNTVNAELDSFLGTPAPDNTTTNGRIMPTFMIHTGDSVDAGLASEFDTFVTESNRLGVPWYQVIGNHDVLAFGNLRLTSWRGGTPMGEDDCKSPGWKGFRCSCTRVAALIRENNIAQPNNRGKFAADEVPYKWMTLAPLLFKRICLSHYVPGDRFIMDPNVPRNPAKDGNSINAFIAAHCDGEITDFEHCRPPPLADKYPIRKEPTDDEPCATFSEDAGKRSVMHGLDLAPKFLDPKTHKPYATEAFIKQEDARPGYYCFEIASLDPTRRAWAVALNTTTDSGAYGEFSTEQGDWLEKLVMPVGQETAEYQESHKGQARRPRQIADRDLVFVFAHHPVWNVYDIAQRERLQYIMTHSPNVVAYLTGHTHTSELRVIHPDESAGAQGHLAGHRVWEVTAPSTLGYPQQARQITVKTIEDLGYIEVLSFSPSGTGDSAEKVRKAQLGAMRDRCHEKPKKCDAGRPFLPGREVTFPRLWFQLPPIGTQVAAPY